MARKAYLAVLERIGHASDPVMLLDQQILALDLFAAGVLLRRVVVFDDLEHIRKGRQIKDQHHHALDTRCNAELVARMSQMVQEVAVEQVLALLAKA